MLNDVVLSISRLSGSATSGRGKNQQNNLAFQCLPALLPDPMPNGYSRDSVQKIADSISVSGEFTKTWRDKILAHRGREEFTGENPIPIPGINNQQIGDAIKGMEEMFHYFARAFTKESLFFMNTPEVGGAEGLVRRLNYGKYALANQNLNLPTI